MPDTAILGRTGEASAWPERSVLAATVPAALAVGLSVSPLGLFAIPSGLGGAALNLDDPWRLAVPALLIAAATAWAALRRRGGVAAWAVTAGGTLAAVAVTGGARHRYDTRWTELDTYHTSLHWFGVLAAVAMGVAVGGLVAAIRSSARPGVLAAAFAVGLVTRAGEDWYQARYDLAAAVLAAVALGVVFRAGRRASGEPAGVGRGEWLTLAVTAAGYLALALVAYTYRVELVAVYGWSDANVSAPIFATAGRVYAVLGAGCALLVAQLAVRAGRVGLTGRQVLATAAVAAALGVGGGGGGWLPGPVTLVAVAVAVAVTWFAPVARGRVNVLDCLELAGIVGLLGGVLRAPGPSYPILIGALIVAVAELRRASSASAAPVLALGLLVFSVTPVARIVAGGLLYRAAPDPDVPLWFDRLGWVMLVGAVVPALVAVGLAASRVSDSAG